MPKRNKSSSSEIEVKNTVQDQVSTTTSSTNTTDNNNTSSKVWIPQIHGEQNQDKTEQKTYNFKDLEYDPTAYLTFHRFELEWPSMSFDILKDGLGYFRKKFPLSMYLVTGCQIDTKIKGAKNTVRVVKINDICKTLPSDDKSNNNNNNEDDDIMFDFDNESDNDIGYDPILTHCWFKHPGVVNRIRAMPQKPNIISTWSEDKNVYIWDIKEQLTHLDNNMNNKNNSHKTKSNMIMSFNGHADEGYAMDWSPVITGQLLTGDNVKYIYYHEPNESNWTTNLTPYNGHTSSVEDIQWSPVERNVFASCSSDKTIKIWDTRERRKPMVNINAHDSDVNVISWNPKVSHLLLSGSEDGSIKIWDLRELNNTTTNGEAARYIWHKAAITSVQFHPTDESVLAASSEDNSISIWDMGLEADEDIPIEGATLDNNIDIPAQLLFLHQGQNHIKELRWHPQIPGLCISTAFDGFNIFKPANIENIEDGIEQNK